MEYKNTADKKLVELVDYLKKNGYIKFTQQFIDSIGMSKQLYGHIKAGRQSFTVKQIIDACDLYNINANWVFGLEETIFRLPVLATKHTEKKALKA